MTNFIHQDTVSEIVCDQLLLYYDNNRSSASKGVLQNGYYPEKKDSNDLYIDPNNECSPFDRYKIELQNCLNNYMDKFPEIKEQGAFQITEPYNLQWYKPNQGFHIEHCERTSLSSYRRVLVFMTYLNDAPNAGTIFKYQNFTSECKKGNTLIWNADWTHTHKGQISQTHDKYIITGWWSYTSY